MPPSNTARARRAPTVAAIAASLAAACLVAPAGAAAQSPAIAFTSFRDGAAGVHAVDVAGGPVRRLAQTPGAAFEGSPAFSPDGRRVAYTCGNFELCVMNADGGAPGRLTTSDWLAQVRYDTAPAWSPDGTLIAFVRTVGGRDGLWVVAPDGSAPRELPVPPGVNGSPSFSPDSRWIAFEHADDRSGGDGDLPLRSDSAVHVIGVDGAGLRRLTPADEDAGNPAWSPAGDRIAYVRSSDDGDDRVYVMNADGSAHRRLTSRRVDATDPAWSPDASRIAYAAFGRDGASLYHVAASEGRPVRLTRGGGLDLAPAWQPPVAATAVPPASPLAPVSAATADARVVGVLLRAFAGLMPAIGALADERASALASAARRMSLHAARISRAARSLRPVTRPGRKVRSTVLRSMAQLRQVAAATRRWARSVRRRDRPAAGRWRRRAESRLVFGVLLSLAAGTGEAGMPQTLL